MVTTGIQPVQLEIQHVGNDSQRMPIGRVKMSERPGKRAKTQAAGNCRIFVNVAVIVALNEAVVKRLIKDDPWKSDQSGADRDG